MNYDNKWPVDEDGFSESYMEYPDFPFDEFESYANGDDYAEDEESPLGRDSNSQRIDPDTGEIIGRGIFTVEDDEDTETLLNTQKNREDQAGEERDKTGSLESELYDELYGSRSFSHPKEDNAKCEASVPEPSRPAPVSEPNFAGRTFLDPLSEESSNDLFPEDSESSSKTESLSQEDPPLFRQRKSISKYFPLGEDNQNVFESSRESYDRESFYQEDKSREDNRGTYIPRSYEENNSRSRFTFRAETKRAEHNSYDMVGGQWSKARDRQNPRLRKSQTAPKDFSEIPSYEYYRDDGKLEYETGFHKDDGRSPWEDYSTDSVEQDQKEIELSFSDRVLDFFTGDEESLPRGENEEASIKRQCILIGVVVFIVLTLASQVFAQLRSGDLLNMNFTFNIPWILWNDGPVIVLAILLGSVFGGAWRYIEWRAEKSRETGEPFTLSGKGTYGTARFASREDLKGDVRFGVRNRPVGIPLCIDPETGDSVSLTYESGKAKHVCVTGLSGSGKGTLIKAQVMSMIDHGWSYVIADPSGDIYKSTATLAEKAKAGYDVYVFNLNDLSVSDGWNPLSIIQKSTQPDVMATSMANSIILNSKQPGEKSDSFYDANEQNLLAALMLYTSVSPMFKGQSYERNLGTVYDMLSRLAETGDLKELDELPSIDPAKAPWNFFKNPKAEKLQPNFVTGLNAKIQTLGLDPVREVLSHDEIDLKRIGQKPTAVYVLTSVVDTKFRFLLSLFFTSAFQQLIEYGDSKDSPEMDNPVYFIMDEFASIGVIPNFMQILANVRKYDIGIEILFQDINQIRQVYGRDDSGSIISNCGKRIVYEVNDAETAKEVSGRTGEATIKNTSISESVNPHSVLRTPSYDQKQSTSDGKRNLLTPDEIMTYTKKSKENMLLISEGKPVFKGKKYRYWYHWLAEFVSAPENIKPSGDNVPEWSMNQKTTELPRTWGGEEVSEDILRIYRKPSSLEEAKERQRLIEEQKKKQEEEDRIREAERRAAEEERRREREESERREAEEFERQKQRRSGRGNRSHSSQGRAPGPGPKGNSKSQEQDSFDLTGFCK